jgi:hypothetical protein
MSPLVPVAALAASCGALVAIGTRDRRACVVGFTVALLASAVLVEPTPPVLAILARAIAALLAGELAWLLVRPQPEDRGAGPDPSAGAADDPIGLLGLAALAVAAFAAGVAVTMSGPGFGGAGDWSTALAMGAGFATLAVALPGLLVGAGADAAAEAQPSAARQIVAAALLLSGAWAVRAAVLGSTSTAESVLLGAAIVAVLGVLAITRSEPAATADTSAGRRSLIGMLPAGRRSRRHEDAHPVAVRPAADESGFAGPDVDGRP